MNQGCVRPGGCKAAGEPQEPRVLVGWQWQCCGLNAPRVFRSF